MPQRVFIIEDEAVVATDLKQNLSRLGYEVVGIAQSGRDALERIPDARPDVLLADVRLRGEPDGIEVVRRLLPNYQVPVIFVTAYSDRETLKRAQTVGPQGYILKPINPRELDIAIDMAIHEFKLKRELIESRQLLNTALSCIGNAVIYIGIDGRVLKTNREAEALLGLETAEMLDRAWRDVVVGSTDICRGRLGRLIENVIQTRSVSRISPLQLDGADGREVVDGIIGPIYEEQDERAIQGVILMLRKLANVEFGGESSVEEPTAQSQARHADVLMLVNPDDFDEVNASLGKSAGDIVLAEVIEEINGLLRLSDLATRYAGAVFSATLPQTSLSDAKAIADRIHEHLSRRSYLGGRVQLTFSIGLAQLESGTELDQRSLPIELFRRATWALNASHQAGGGRVTVWDPSERHRLLADLDRGSGKFSPQPEDDYRGLMLLWNTVQAVSNSPRLDLLAQQVVAQIRQSMRLTLAAFLVRAEGEPLEFAAAETEQGLIAGSDALDLEVSEPGIVEALALAHPQVIAVDGPSDDQTRYVLPLVVNGAGVGALVMDRGSQDPFSVEQIRFLERLSAYLGVAVDRLLLAGRENARTERGEVALAHSAADSALLYESMTMQALLDELRLVAPTDATVMISGESGTGKELIARTLHRMSPRRDRPFIVVDCGTIVPSLMESELFGHRKGAFTNASQDRTGKVSEADGGTLFLDEVGELPLDLQTKLLRFAQERTFTPVGDHRVRSVDVRLVVATNRDLAAAVEAGTFRSDLFYRLNVFCLEVPPLNDRAEDALVIARHFARQFATEYGKEILGLAASAERALREYSWPGNVRELRNVMLRAVIRCQSPYIDAAHLEEVLKPNGATRTSPAAASPDSTSDRKRALDEALERMARAAAAHPLDVNLGDWFEHTCLRLARDHSGGIATDAARMLGMPDSTLRRRWQVLGDDFHGTPPEDPESLVTALTDALAKPIPELGNVLGYGLRKLASALDLSGLSHRQGAQVLGVSEPTYRKYRRESSRLAS